MVVFKAAVYVIVYAFNWELSAVLMQIIHAMCAGLVLKAENDNKNIIYGCAILQGTEILKILC